jgi:hypothetical protein
MPGVFALKPLFAHQPRPPQTTSDVCGSSLSSSVVDAIHSDERQTTAVGAAGQESSLLGETFDFGVVAVYSCPNSCCYSDDNDNNIDNSSNKKVSRLRFEIAVVQPPV